MGVHIVTNDGAKLNHAIRLNFKIMNNETKYKAVLVGLDIVEASSGEEIEMRADLQVVFGQIKREYLEKGPKRIKYLH